MRKSVIQYAIDMATVAASRSEDPHCKVGAIALTRENRIIAVAYNGLPTGLSAPEGWWDDREKRLPYVIHAEENLCSLFRRGEVDTVVTTLQPCSTCMRLLSAHGVKCVVYKEPYARDDGSNEIANFYQLKLVHYKE